MTKITKNNFAKRLAKYGALSVAIAGVADATGQVVYTDVDPDFVGGLGDSFAIDFDGDGTDDVTILQSNNGNYELVQANAATGNGVAQFDAGNAYVYASNLAQGVDIDGSLTFASFGSMCAGPGYTGSQFCGTGPSFAGIQFTAGGGTTHYAWVRVDVADSENFQVLDYAFEATPDTAIAAGDEGSLGVNDQLFEGFNFFVSNEQLNLSAANAMNNVTVYSILGQQVVNQKLSGTNETVNLAALSTGVYVAKVSIDGAVKTIKFVK